MTTPKKKTSRRRTKATKAAPKTEPTETETPENVEPIGPQYQLSREELLTYQAFKSKFDLADEKIKLAQSERETATFMRDSLYQNIVNRLSLQNKKINLNFEQGTVTVLEENEAKKKKSK